MRRVFLFFEDASMPPMSVQRLGEAITHLAARTPKPWRTTRRLRRAIARAPLLRTEAVLSRILLAAGAALSHPETVEDDAATTTCRRSRPPPAH